MAVAAAAAAAGLGVSAGRTLSCIATDINIKSINHVIEVRRHRYVVAIETVVAMTTMTW